MDFQIYRPRTKAKEDPKPIVKLSKTTFILNKVAREQLNTPEYVELAFDKDTNTIRIRPSTVDDGNALKKTKVLAPGFFEDFEISSPGAYNAKYNQGENALYVNLV